MQLKLMPKYLESLENKRISMKMVSQLLSRISCLRRSKFSSSRFFKREWCNSNNSSNSCFSSNKWSIKGWLQIWPFKLCKIMRIRRHHWCPTWGQVHSMGWPQQEGWKIVFNHIRTWQIFSQKASAKPKRDTDTWHQGLSRAWKAHLREPLLAERQLEVAREACPRWLRIWTPALRPIKESRSKDSNSRHFSSNTSSTWRSRKTSVHKTKEDTRRSNRGMIKSKLSGRRSSKSRWSTNNDRRCSRETPNKCASARRSISLPQI